MIKLPRYTEKIPDYVYTDREVIVIPNKDPLIRTKVVLLCKYDAPTEESVIAYLREMTEKISGTSALVLPEGARSEEGVLEGLIRQFPQQLSRDILSKKRECIEFIKPNIPALPAARGIRQYLLVRGGYLIPALEEQYKHLPNDWYATALSSPSLQKCGLGEFVQIRILMQNGCLPPRQEMDVLLRNETAQSKTLTMLPQYHAEGVSIIQEVYEGIQTPEHWSVIKDISAMILEEATIAGVGNSFFKKSKKGKEE